MSDPAVPPMPGKKARTVITPMAPEIRPAPPSAADSNLRVRSSQQVAQHIAEAAAQQEPQPAPKPESAPQPDTSGAPVTPADTPRVRDRIRQLYGRWKGAQDEVERYRAEVENLRKELAATRTAPAPAPTPTMDYGFEQVQPAAPSAGITRDELRQELENWTRQQQIANAQIASRLEAERLFPDVFADSESAQAVDEILQYDEALRTDPAAAVKAALIVRGLRVTPPKSSAADDARKAALSGPGATVPEGGSAGPASDSTEAQYIAAMERAKLSQRPEDWHAVFQLRNELRKEHP